MTAIERDHACFQDLHWRLSLAPGLDWDALEARLAPALARESSPTFLRVLSAEDGCQIVIVPRTGRVQIRVDPLIPLAERRPCAEKLARLLDGAIEG